MSMVPARSIYSHFQHSKTGVDGLTLNIKTHILGVLKLFLQV